MAVFFSPPPTSWAQQAPGIVDCAALHNEGTYGRLASNDTGECVILDTVIVSVAEGYVEQAAAGLESRAGWSIRDTWFEGKMLLGLYSPDNLSSDQLLAEIDAISNEPWASHAGYDSFAGIAGKPNAAPVFTSSATHTVAENQWTGGTVAATDDDTQDSVSYSIAGGVDAALFRIYSGGLLEFKRTEAPDYEAPHDANGDNRYQLIVRASSGTGDRWRTADQAVTVTVTDANDAPTGLPTITGTQTVGQTLTAATSGIADQDGLTTPGWVHQWVRVDGSTNTDISGATGSTYALASADQGKKVKVRVSFTDDGSNAHSLESEDSDVIAAAAATGTAPRFTSDAAFNAAENQTAVATVTALDDDAQETSVTFAIQGGVDQSKFSITTSGTLTFAAAPDYENPTDAASTTPSDAAGNNKYIVEVRATSGDGARQKYTDQTITVTVTDANDAATGTASITGTEQVGQTLTASTSNVADQDGLPNPVAYTYQWQQVESGTATDISGANGSTYALASADQGKKVKVKVSFADSKSNAESLTSAETGTIAAAPADLATAPDAVASIQVTHNGRSLTVSWEAPARATHYDVTYSGGGVNARAAWNRSGTSLTITCDSRDGTNCVTPGTAYTVGVRVRNSAGASAWADSAATPLPSAPDAVTNIQVTHNGSSLTVSWDASARATGYDVTYSGGGVNARAAWNRAGTSLTITCDSRDGTNCVSSGTTYTVGARALNAGGESAWRDSAPASD